MRHLKKKAVFMIYLTLSLMFTVYLMPTLAQEGSPIPEETGISKGCCERTSSGDTCIYTDVSECVKEYKKAPFQKCEETAFCRVGCCVDPEGGSCSKQTSKGTCEAAGYDWQNNPDCSQVNECQKGCCVLASSSCAYVTEKKCDSILSDYPELKKDFRDAKSETECSGICREADKGCCVKETNSDCIWTSRASCDMDDGIGGKGFYQNLKCSDENLPCSQCKPKDRKGCMEGSEDVYWFDSCGNPEGIAEDCNYNEGTLCGLNKDNEPICKSVNCLDTWDNDAVEGDGGQRINGESWCEFDGAIGPSLDMPGSRHFRHICINGEEIVEECKDFREEVCRQSDVHEPTSTGSTGKLLYTAAACTPNRWKDCTTKCYTAKDKTDKDERKIAIKMDKKCCERSDLRDCVWWGDESNGICIPYHPPGFKFWAAAPATATTTAPQQLTTQTADNDNCDVSTKECKVLFTKMIYTNWKWSCMPDGNCGCYSDDYLKSQNAYCRSIGDCGAHYNYMGGFSDSGFTRAWDKGYQGWDIKFDRGKTWQSGYYNKDSKEPKILVTKEMIGAFGTAWKFADEKLYSDKIEKPSGNIVKAITITLTIVKTTTVTLLTALEHEAAAGWVGGIGIAVLAYIALTEIALRKYEERTVTTTCGLWRPPPGGENCEKCGNDYHLCSEYMCRSLGATCGFISENEGTKRKTCYNKDPNDVTKPLISPWEEALKITSRGKDITGLYRIVESQNGYTITAKERGKVPAFSSITFGIKTNENSQCRLGREMKNTFKELELKFAEDYFDEYHNMTLTSLAPATDYKYYIICRDPAGNPKEEDKSAPYSIQFSTDNSPDLEPPILVSASIPDQGYVAADADTTTLTLMIDEVSPFSCKASKQDQPFDSMEMNMSCTAMPVNSLFSKYARCQIELPVSENLNTYYFRCRDEPENSERQNENTESYIWRALKAKRLNISNFGPSGTLYTSNATLQVITINGAENGKAICYYDNIEFFSTNSTQHLQKLSGLTKQDYSYNIRCKDRANNIAAAAINFTVDIDLEPPKIIGITKLGPAFNIKLDEEASCLHSFDPLEPDLDKLQASMKDSYSIPDTGRPRIYFNCKDIYSNFMESVIITKVKIKPENV